MLCPILCPTKLDYLSLNGLYAHQWDLINLHGFGEEKLPQKFAQQL
jgi:hypothetical protein